MEEKSWGCTIVTQLSLCIAAYIAFNIGQPQKLTHGNISNGGFRPIDMYFISVAGGFRPLEEQTLLLQQMAKVQKAYKARFVVDISELGQSDPLFKNATMFPELQSIPWYTSGSLGVQKETYFLKKIEIPYGQTLDVIALDTVLFQDPSSVRANDQILWLTRILKESDSDWKIVVGLDQLVTCDYSISKMEKETPFEPLHSILLQYGVDVYMSMKTCHKYVHRGANVMGSSTTVAMNKGPYLTAMNQNLVFKEETVDGFLLHQVSSLEMDTFAVKLTGEIEHKLLLQQRGKAAM